MLSPRKNISVRTALAACWEFLKNNWLLEHTPIWNNRFTEELMLPAAVDGQKQTNGNKVL